MTPYAKTAILAMNASELDRLYRRVYSRIMRLGGTAFGVDMPTLRIVRPGLAAIVDTILEQGK